MKLSKYVGLVKRESYCVVAHVEGDGIWLGTRSAFYRATELPDMVNEDQIRTVLDIDQKAWEKIYLEEEYCNGTQNVLGLDLQDCAEEEQIGTKILMQAAHMGGYATGLRCEDGELLFYDDALTAPLIDQLKKSSYIVMMARKTASGKRYIVVKDGLKVLAAFLTLDILTEEYLKKLDEFQVWCVEQYAKERMRHHELEANEAVNAL